MNDRKLAIKKIKQLQVLACQLQDFSIDDNFEKLFDTWEIPNFQLIHYQLGLITDMALDIQDSFEGDN